MCSVYIDTDTASWIKNTSNYIAYTALQPFFFCYSLHRYRSEGVVSSTIVVVFCIYSRYEKKRRIGKKRGIKNTVRHTRGRTKKCFVLIGRWFSLDSRYEEKMVIKFFIYIRNIFIFCAFNLIEEQNEKNITKAPVRLFLGEARKSQYSQMLPNDYYIFRFLFDKWKFQFFSE